MHAFRCAHLASSTLHFALSDRDARRRNLSQSDRHVDCRRRSHSSLQAMQSATSRVVLGDVEVRSESWSPDDDDGWRRATAAARIRRDITSRERKSVCIFKRSCFVLQTGSMRWRGIFSSNEVARFLSAYNARQFAGGRSKKRISQLVYVREKIERLVIAAKRTTV